MPRLARTVAIERLLLDHLDVLETMGPEGFLEFRDPLEPASGFQSVQFRAIEWISGLRDTFPADAEPPPGPSLYEAFVRLRRAAGGRARRGWRRSRSSTATTRTTPSAPGCTASPSGWSTTTRASRSGATTTC